MSLPKRIIKVCYSCIALSYIMKETERLMADPAPGIQATPHEDNLRYFNVIMSGPAQSPFEGMLLD